MFQVYLFLLLLYLISKVGSKLISVKEIKSSKRPSIMSKKDSEHIWFDGVDKKLLEMNSIKPAPVDGNDHTLVTKTPLASFSSYSVQKKNKNKLIDKSTKKSDDELNGKKLNGVKRSKKEVINPNSGITDELALDCEMVECYHHKSVLARVSIVNLFGKPILDRYVAPPAAVTDYRTKYSGIRKRDLDNAPSFETIQKEVADLIKGRIVVGHAIHNDFSVLKLSHPESHTRDTSLYFRYLFQGKTPSLKKLSESILGVKIQKGEHDSVQDAQATMKLYVKERDRWNQTLTHNGYHNPQKNKAKKKQKTLPIKKKVKTFYVNTT